MLTKKKQRKYLDRNNVAWQQQLQTFADSQNPEALHQLRVSLKKIRALAHFSNACSRAGKNFNGWKKMFKQAGLVRDSLQPDTRIIATQRFIQHIKQYRRQGKRACKRLDSTIRNIPSACIRDWYAVQIVSTGILLTSSGDELHQARKQIKEMLYMEKLLPPSTQNELHLDRDYLDKLQDTIGLWHDDVVAGADPKEKEAQVRLLADNFYLRINR